MDYVGMELMRGEMWRVLCEKEEDNMGDLKEGVMELGKYRGVGGELYGCERDLKDMREGDERGG